MRHVLITGTSTGIGYKLTEDLLKEDFVVWAGLRSPQALESLAQKYPQKLHVLKLDVTSSQDIAEAYSKISVDPTLKEFYLVNNAGIAIGGPIEALPISEWKKLFDTNVFGLIEMTKTFLPLLRRTQGRVVNIGSISGRVAPSFVAPYSASKFAVRAFSDSLRREMIDQGVKVILIEPGPIKTPIWDKSISRSQQLEKELTPEMKQVYGKTLIGMQASVEMTAASAVPVDHVTRKILKALNSPNPCAYYLIGKGIRLTAFFVKHLPTKTLDRLISRGFRFQKAPRQ
ncbi:SDR family oxidoreductase [Bdellovibrio sp. HCB337]|uniref:SDR family oxidoreductase n=1 Tax=Bdellovibrio sp. HCB337 TaxID=3394358 RepID=UPI0039A641EC